MELLVLACQELFELQGQSWLGIGCWHTKLVASCEEVKDFGVRRLPVPPSGISLNNLVTLEGPLCSSKD